MPGGHPTIGGINGVPVLDIGQDGGVRDAAGDARFSGNLTLGPDRTRAVPQGLPQQNIKYVNTMGFDGATHRLDGVIRAKTAAILTAIVNELNERKHGALRDGTSGVLGTPTPAMLKETQLTDFDGTVISRRARLTDWRQTGRRIKTAEWAIIMPVSIDIEVLG